MAAYTPVDERVGLFPVEQRPTPLPYPVGSPGGVGLGSGPRPQQLPPGLQYLAEQVKAYEDVPGGFKPLDLGWVHEWHKGELFAHRGVPDNIRWQTREEEERHWNSGWLRMVLTPKGYEWLPCEPPGVARGEAISGDPYYIPWVLPDPMQGNTDAQHPGLVWYARQNVPYDPQPRILGRGTEEFTKTRRILKKITWYVPEDVEVGPPRLPVKIFGRPPPDVMPRPRHKEVVDTSDAVDLTGLRESPAYKEHLAYERRALQAEYKRQAQLTKDEGRHCANALV